MLRVPASFKINRRELLFFPAYGLYMMFSVLRTSLYYQYFEGSIYKLVIMASMLLLAAAELFGAEAYKNRQKIGISVALVIYMLIAYASGSLITGVGVVPLLIFAARKIDFKKIAVFTILLVSAIVFLVVLTSKVNIVRNIVIISSSGRRREYLGFRFPLNAPTFIFNVTALYLYLRKDALKILEVAVLIAVNTYFYLKTDSKLSYFLIVFMIAACWAMGHCYDFVYRQKKLLFVLSFSFLIAFVFSIIISLAYDPHIKFMHEANEFVEDRLKFASKSLKEYGITAFGEDIPWIGYGLDAEGKKLAGGYDNYFYVDNMYIQIMQRYGVIFMGTYLVLNTMAMNVCRKTKDIYMLLIVSIIAARCIIDNLSFQIYYNTFWFIISYRLLSRRNVMEDLGKIKRYIRQRRRKSLKI